MATASPAPEPVVPIPSAAGDPGPSLYGVVDILRPDRIAGWVIDRRDSRAALDVEIRREGRLVATIKAAHLRRDLERTGVGTGRYGFSCDLDPPIEPGFEFTLAATARATDGTTQELRRPSSQAGSDPNRRLLERVFEEIRRQADHPAAGTLVELRDIVQRLEVAQARIEAGLDALETPLTPPTHAGPKVLLAVAITTAATSLAIGLFSMWMS